ncbi:MAG: glycosyltransferase family 2 protein [Firmicutes bacterium]|nr:glycosyltransferase family 2 protein [Bacillota bacterium]
MSQEKRDLTVSVVIPVYNRRVIMEKTLTYLARQTLDPTRFEVIVVDDASTDGLKKMTDNLCTPYRLRYFRMSERSGPAAARNRGITEAQGDLIVFIDSDLAPAPELLEAHLKVHESEDDVIGHGPVIHTTDLDNPTAARMKLTDISRAFFATGNVSIRREHLFKAGLFDEEFREYGWEDLELGRRLRRLKLRAVKVPEAKGYHYKASLRLSQLPGHIERERQRARTAVIYYRKHPERAVRMSIELSPVFFWLDRLFSVGGWTERQSTLAFLRRLEERGCHLLLRILVRLITHHAYMDELRRSIPLEDPARRWVR